MYLKYVASRLLITLVILINLISAAYAEKITQGKVDLSAPYAIVLASANVAFTEKDLGITLTSNKHRYYSVRVKSKGKIAYQLRLGFFKTKAAAAKTQDRLNTLFDGSYIIKTSQKERNISANLKSHQKNI